jgi:hypothetical protein
MTISRNYATNDIDIKISARQIADDLGIEGKEAECAAKIFKLVKTAIEQERERCAKIAEASHDDISVFATAIAEEIREAKS